jgi:hypothetical protein
MACLAPTTEGGSLLDSCFRAAATLTGTRGQPVVPSSATAFGQGLAAALPDLDRARERARERLSHPPSAAAQGAAVTALAGAYGRTAAVLAPLAPRTDADTTATVRTMRTASRDYRAVALALSTGDDAAFDRARRGVRRDEARLTRLLRGVAG